MHDILLAIGVTAFVIYAIFSIANILEMRKASVALRRLIEGSEENLYSSLAAMRGILEDIKKTTDNVVILTESVREIAETAQRVEKNVKELYGYYVEGMGETARANMAGLKAGVKAGVTSLLRDMSEKKEGSL